MNPINIGDLVIITFFAKPSKLGMVRKIIGGSYYLRYEIEWCDGLTDEWTDIETQMFKENLLEYRYKNES